MTNDEKLQHDRTRVTRSRRNILKSILCLPAAGLIGSAAASYTVSADSENTLTLYSGWNLVGVVDEVTVEELENKSNPNVTISSETVYQLAKNGEYNESRTLRPGRGYWVKVSDVGGINPLNSKATFNFQQQRAGTTQIYEGWNIIAVSHEIGKPELKSAGVFDGLEPVGGNLFFELDAEEGEYLSPEKLSPAEGYWVYASESKSVVTGAWYDQFRDMAERLKEPFMRDPGDALESLQNTLEPDFSLLSDLSLAVAGAYLPGPGVALASKAIEAADAIETALEATVNWSVGAYREEWSKNITKTTKENYANKLGYPDVQDKPIRKLFSSWIDQPDIWKKIFVRRDKATPAKRAEGLQDLLYKLEATEQATSQTLGRQKENSIVGFYNGEVKEALDKILTAYVELLQLGIGVVRANLRNYYPNRSFAQTIQNLTQPTADKVADQIRNGEGCQRRYANDRLRQLEESGQVKSVRRDSKNVYKTTGGQQITLQGQGQTVQAPSETPPPPPSSQTVTPIVEQYDQNDDGDISVEELGEAGQDFAADELTIEELAEIGQEFAND